MYESFIVEFAVVDLTGDDDYCFPMIGLFAGQTGCQGARVSVQLD